MKRSVAVVSLVLVLALVLLAAPPVSAQDLEVAVGSRIRFHVPSVTNGRLEGTVVSLDESAFTLRLKDQKDVTVFQRAAVEKLEIRTREGHRAKGALIGFAIGTVALGTVLLASSDDDFRCPDIDCMLTGALVGGVPFAVIGALASQGANWESVPTHGVSFWVAPRLDRGVEARLSVRF
jgi:hypothetical protein